MHMAMFSQQEYKRTQVETSNPGRVLLTLYQAAIRFVSQGMAQIEAGDAAGKGASLGRAHAIIAEFINALDHKMAPKLCANLEQIYIFMLDNISQANQQMNPEPLVPVLRHLNEMLATWEKAVSQANLEEARRNMSR